MGRVGPTTRDTKITRSRNRWVGVSSAGRQYSAMVEHACKSLVDHIGAFPAGVPENNRPEWKPAKDMHHKGVQLGGGAFLEHPQEDEPWSLLGRVDIQDRNGPLRRGKQAQKPSESMNVPHACLCGRWHRAPQSWRSWKHRPTGVGGGA